MLSVSSQRGSALLISLVILTAITLGAVVAMQRSTLQVRMVGNMQHQQNVFNAAQSDLSSLIEQLRSMSKANDLLFKAIQAENSTSGSEINPFTQGGLTKPRTHKNMKDTKNKLRVISLPSAASNSLKATEGSSGGTLVPYYFANKVDAVDKNDNAQSFQEVGFYYLAPAPNQ